ncbi:unnamed protein product [Fusarium fujikuroi]|nr:unnamed protein product [Fusarium fujikuroi]
MRISPNKISSPLYLLQSVALLGPLIKGNAQRLTQCLKSGTTSPINTYTLCGLFSFKVICQAGFTKDFSNDINGIAAYKLL